MAREIKIKIASGFDPSGISAASAAMDKMVDDLEKSNKWLMQCNAELSAAIKKHASSVAVDMSAAADKAAKGMGNTYKTLADYLGDVRKESQEASRKLEEIRAKIQAASKAVAEARAAKAMKNVGEEASKSVGGVNKLGTAIRTLTQGTSFLGKAITGIFTGGIWEVGAAGVRMVIGAIQNAWEEHKKKVEEQRKFVVDTINSLAEKVEEYKIAIADAANAEREAAQAGLNARKSEIDLTERLTKATIELSKQKRIAAGEDSETVNAEASGQMSEASAKSARAKSDAEIAAIERRIEIAKDESEKAWAEVERLRDAKAEMSHDWQFLDPEQQKAQRKLRRAVSGKIEEARGVGFGADERVKAEEAALAAALKSRDALEKEIEAGELKASNEKKAREQAAIKARTEAEKAAAEKRAEEEKKAAEKAARERERLDAQEAARRERERQAELAARIRDHQKLLAAERAEESKTRSAVSAAESKLQQAWGWYRDKDSMAAQIAEEKADAQARKQFEKDFERLKDRRRDWRKAENLSVDDEAVRRVALAREEKEAAERHLAEIERNTADLAAKLDELLQVKG